MAKWYSGHDWKIHPGLRRDCWIVYTDQQRFCVTPYLAREDQESLPHTVSRWTYLWELVQEQLKRDGLKK